MLRKTYIDYVEADTYKMKDDKRHFIPETAEIKDYNGEETLIIKYLFFDRYSNKWREDTEYINLDKINQNFLQELLKLKEKKTNQ